MWRARTSRHNSTATGAFLISVFGLLAGVRQAHPAAAQGAPPAAGGGPAGGGPEAPAVTGGAPAVQPALPGGGPDILPLVPGGGFGFPNPLNPPATINNAAPPAAAAAPFSPLGLTPPGYGVVPLQANDPNAPAYLIRPYASVAETLSDNLRYQPSPRVAGAYTNLSPGLSFSADTPRLQAILSGNMNTYFYVPTSDLNQVFANLYASGFGTIYPDLLFVDLTSTITQSSTLPGFGFQNLSQLPTNQQTQVYANTISPYLRKSFDGLVDTELRYRFGSTNFGGNTAVATSTPGALSNLSSGILNEGILTAATGQDFRRALSRLTIDASNFNSSATTRNTQFSSYDDLEYRITPQASALTRVGYQNIQYPFAAAATFVGATWLVGGRIGTYGPEQKYFALEYGRQQGVYGFTGSARYNITPTMLLTASLVQGISSPTQYIQNTLATSTLNPYGSIVDEYSGLPAAFYSPGLGLTNNVYKQHLFNVGITESMGPNTYSLYGTYTSQQALTPPVTSAPTKGYGVNLIWNRAIRPDLNGVASLGYFNTANVLTVSTPTPVASQSQNNVTAYLGVNYLFGPDLTGSIFYRFSYQTNGAVSTGRSGDVVVNQLTFQLSKAF
jgi:uncharacterized protein (PEP-CTERM system associated)